MNTIDFSELPIWEDGANKGNIKWKMSVGHKINFVYNELIGELIVKKFIQNGQKLIVSYCGRDYNTCVSALYQCSLGNILGLRTIKFKIQIGEKFTDNKRDIVITSRFYKKYNSNKIKKFYIYKCNVCDATELEINEYNLINGKGCSCCYGRTVVEGINDIPTTAPWMIKYFQGGYEEAKGYTKSSNKKIHPICPECGRIKNKLMQINTIYANKSIPCVCSDGISYPEKFMLSFLSQIGIEFTYQLTKTKFEWCNNYQYDFYINKKSCIIEVHGSTHYNKNGFGSLGGRTLNEEKNNDIAKELLAKNNGIKHYIIIDARQSDMEWIINSIINSKLFSILDSDVKNIDWNECERHALSNKVKDVCEYWNKGIKTPSVIARLVKLHPTTVSRYLKKGAKIGWCDYSKDKVKHNRKINRKKVAIYKDGLYLNSFESISYLSEKSIELFGTKFFISEISKCCNGKTGQYKGYKFEFLESENYIER